jgi:hypothetical protein
MSAHLTQHAQQRIRQRGRKESDVDFVLAHGTECRDGVLFSNKDCARLVEDARRKIALASRLAGTFIACDGATVKTVFRASKDQQQRMLSAE